MLAKTATFSDPLALSVPKHTLRKTGSGRRGQGRRGQEDGVREDGVGKTGSGNEFRSSNGIREPILNLRLPNDPFPGRRGQGTNSGQATESGNQFSISDSPTILSPQPHPAARFGLGGRDFIRGFVALPSVRSGCPLSLSCETCFRSSLRRGLRQRHKGTKAQRHKGTKAQRHKGTKGQRDRIG